MWNVRRYKLFMDLFSTIKYYFYLLNYIFIDLRAKEVTQSALSLYLVIKMPEYLPV